MRNVILMMTVVLALTIPIAAANAAEVILPIKARIIRCVTYEERRQMCQEEHVCCHLLDTTIATETTARITDEQSSLDVPVSENTEVHEIHHNGLISLAIE